MIIPKKQLVLL